MTRIIIGLATIIVGIFSVVTFDAFTGNGLVQVLGGFTAMAVGVALVVFNETFQEL